MKADALLQKAAEVVGGDRAQAHGSMEETHQLIADFWQLYLDNRREKKKPLTSQDVAMMMVLLKCARSQRGRLEVDDYLGYGWLHRVRSANGVRKTNCANSNYSGSENVKVTKY